MPAAGDPGGPVTGSPHSVVPDVRRIAVLRATGVGDFLMILPALQAVRRAYPGARLTLLGDDWLPELLRGRPGPWDEIVVVPKFPGLRGMPPDAEPADDLAAFVDEHAGRYDLVLQLHGGGATSNRFVRLLRPRVSAGARAPGAPPLDRSIGYLRGRHELLRWLEAVALVGAAGPAALDELRPTLPVTAGDLAEADGALRTTGPFAAIHAGARDPRRCWPAENFARLAQRLHEGLGLAPVLVGGPEDIEQSAQVRARCDIELEDLTGRLSLPGTLGLLRRSTLFAGNDSGVRHLAVAVGTPTVGLFWIGNVPTFGPLVGTSDEILIAGRVNCPVCGEPQIDTRCPHDVSFLGEITVDAVYDAAASLLEERRRGPAPGSRCP